VTTRGSSGSFVDGIQGSSPATPTARSSALSGSAGGKLRNRDFQSASALNPHAPRLRVAPLPRRQRRTRPAPAGGTSPPLLPFPIIAPGLPLMIPAMGSTPHRSASSSTTFPQETRRPTRRRRTAATHHSTSPGRLVAASTRKFALGGSFPKVVTRGGSRGSFPKVVTSGRGSFPKVCDDEGILRILR
jgi:hypothetical protein